MLSKSVEIFSMINKNIPYTSVLAKFIFLVSNVIFLNIKTAWQTHHHLRITHWDTTLSQRLP